MLSTYPRIFGRQFMTWVNIFNSYGDEVDPCISYTNEELPRPEPSEVPSQEPKSKKQARNDRKKALSNRGTSDGTN
ncbi:hypothetical protein CFAM422_011471 [Trichoderma lentiforme]|uniref:Uncharacterized protein n=1 Tax=Trichoderma lentiforme TaxID=1567552 RepID=A0A9P4X6I0_9HYPO|nr:hypothetical protein CFAM422_011471 [Trichoderma lentiforme]